MSHSLIKRLATKSIFLSMSFLFAASALLCAEEAEKSAPTQTGLAAMVIGLPAITQAAQGTLSVDSTAIYFQTPNGSAMIDRKSIIDFTSGDERVETGGKLGKFARLLLPYASGHAMGVFTHKTVKLLIVEFLDGNNDYRGVVFVLQSEDMKKIMSRLENQLPRFDWPSNQEQQSCPASQIQANTVRVEPIVAELRSKLVPADRVLLYEYLVHQLESDRSIARVYRAGDSRPEANCSEFVITVNVIAFKKGDQAVRASVEPLEHFFGATRLHYHLTVLARGSNHMIDKDMKKSEGTDSDSLNITKVSADRSQKTSRR